jgi:predicted nuclease of restriction endonuclease-like (RecB) superfamily
MGIKIIAMKYNLLNDKNYKKFVLVLKERIAQARCDAYQAVNKELISLYWDIGLAIADKQKKLGWGDSVVEKVAVDLRRLFPDMRGFSVQNIWRMRQLYETYCCHTKLSTLLRELPWSHNLLLLHRTGSLEEKEFYMKTCVKEHWSFRELERQIESSLFERYMLSRKTKNIVPRSKVYDSSTRFKNEYLLDFLGLKEEFSEKDLRKAIVDNLKMFFLEFGKYFTFVGEEYPVSVGGEDYKVDLLLYHRMLRCLVVVELKIGDFKPEYVGKMQFYLEALDRKNKLNHENASIGLILCKSRKKETVDIALSRVNSPMKVALYKTNIIDKKLLKQRLHALPFPR